MKIVNFEVYDKNKQIRLLVLENSEEFWIDEDIFCAKALYDNPNLSLEDIEIYRIQTETKLAKRKAFMCLARKSYTKKEIESKLFKYKYPQKIIDDVVSKLIELNYINDDEYIERYISEKKHFASCSAKKLHYDLELKGFKRQKIDEILSISGFSEDEAIKKIFSKKFASINFSDFTKLEKNKQIAKIIKYFLSKGFKYENVQKVIYEYIDTTLEF